MPLASIRLEEPGCEEPAAEEEKIVIKYGLGIVLIMRVNLEWKRIKVKQLT